jgi:hypothetical protein
MVAVAKKMVRSPRSSSRARAPRQVETNLGRLCAAAVREALIQGASHDQAEGVATLVVLELLLKDGRYEAARELLGAR